MEFEYDLMGRRIKKTAVEKETFHQNSITHFWWNGMQMVNEINDKEQTSCLFIYNDFSYEPLARIERYNDDPTKDRINYFQTHINGCPEEMTNANGDIIWRNRLNLWGKTLSENSVGENRLDQNLRFQGQYLDRETGLHYNTFRYYDPEIGRFTQPDPIGLAGGINLYQYAPNTIGWIDPWGWKKSGSEEEIFETSRAARREAMRQAGIPTSQQPISQSRNASGYEYRYDIPKDGGGTTPASVQQQTMDSSHKDQPHWEAGKTKVHDDGSPRMNRYGRPQLQNDKGKANYRNRSMGGKECN